ncbi:hypothetical protein C8R46DRAFT_346533 [Mycena filopes]|nr:hypothetical protein C8R46DRAFT_346533 [Mycena filopes]
MLTAAQRRRRTRHPRVIPAALLARPRCRTSPAHRTLFPRAVFVVAHPRLARALRQCTRALRALTPAARFRCPPPAPAPPQLTPARRPRHIPVARRLCPRRAPAPAHTPVWRPPHAPAPLHLRRLAPARRHTPAAQLHLWLIPARPQLTQAPRLLDVPAPHLRRRRAPARQRTLARRPTPAA